VVFSITMNRVFYIKLTHAILFLLMTFSVLYILYSGVTRTYNWVLIFSISTVTLESLALLLNRWRCPLTDLAMKYGATEEQARVTSLFCPKWFVPYVFKVYGVLFIFGLIFASVRYLF
jgi:hypothetical protein